MTELTTKEKLVEVKKICSTLDCGGGYDDYTYLSILIKLDT